MSDTETDGLAFRAEGDQVFKNPVTTHNPDGSRSVTMGFPVCTVSEWVNGGAENVAGLLSQGKQASAELDRLWTVNAQMLDTLQDVRVALAMISDANSRRRVNAVFGKVNSAIDAALQAAEALDNGS